MAVPTTMFNVKNIWTLTLYLRDTTRNRGWSERFNYEIAELLPSGSGTIATTSQATTAAGKIIGYRRALLGNQVLIDYARMTKTSTNSAAFKINTSPLAPIDYTAESPHGAVDSSGSGLVFRLQSASGKHSNRLFVGVRDGLITASAVTGVTLSDYDCSSPPSTSGDGTGQAAEASWKAWMSVLQTLTFRARRISGGFTVEPWSCASFLRVSSKKLGTHIVA